MSLMREIAQRKLARKKARAARKKAEKARKVALHHVPAGFQPVSGLGYVGDLGALGADPAVTAIHNMRHTVDMAVMGMQPGMGKGPMPGMGGGQRRKMDPEQIEQMKAKAKARFKALKKAHKRCVKELGKDDPQCQKLKAKIDEMKARRDARLAKQSA